MIISIELFLSDRLRANLTGLLTPQEAFSGFSRSAVITIRAIFILAEVRYFICEILDNQPDMCYYRDVSV